MKLKQIRHLVDAGSFTTTSTWQRIERELRQGIEAIVWPPGSQRFTINPVRKGNGVKPIKEGFITVLRGLGWELEQKFPPGEDEASTKLPGKLDAMLSPGEQGLAPFAVEWETGNIASSHRAMNKMALALKQGRVVGGVLVLPSRALYRGTPYQPTNR